MAMGHRERLKGGDEYDYLTRARRFLYHRAGQIKKIKRKFWKRTRKIMKSKIKNTASDDLN